MDFPMVFSFSHGFSYSFPMVFPTSQQNVPSTKVQELAQRLDDRLRATRERMEEPFQPTDITWVKLG